ncbi:MAG: DNA mismatch repair protein MutS [Candidatus Cloacimonetes bacterium]|nr:DNA mismatch repair protein MutS [Candidatus Cloacimonadota bacterium]
MKAHLLYFDRDLDRSESLCFGHENLDADLEMGSIIKTMAQGDELIEKVCSHLIFQPLEDINAIIYRQDILRDTLDHPEAVRKLFCICKETASQRRMPKFSESEDSIEGMFKLSVMQLELYEGKLEQLRRLSDESIAGFHSRGFRNLFAMLCSELSDQFLCDVEDVLAQLGRQETIMVRASFGTYLQGVSYRLCLPNGKLPESTIASTAEDVEKRRERAIRDVTDSLVQAVGHLDAFFAMLKLELAFYVGCINLRDTLKSFGLPCCLPTVQNCEITTRSWSGLYDVSLSLAKSSIVAGNDMRSENCRVVIITGANQGGKSTFLRSIGQAQLMAQCGMLTGAKEFSCPVRKGIFTHFKKKEDFEMKSGKLDEELARMNEILDHLSPMSLVLFNESFASTNEHEGSIIIGGITKALEEDKIEVFSVTHLCSFAISFKDDNDVLFLRAERLESGRRTFRIIKGEPLPTAYGEDLYRRIFSEP